MAENKARPLRRLLRNASAEDRGLFGLTALYTLCAVVSPALPVLLSGLAVATLTGPAPRAEQLLVIVGVFFLAGALCAFLKEWLMDLAKPRITALRIDYVRQTAVKMVRMDYRHVESASFYEKWEQALNATSGNDNGVEGVYHKLFQAPELTLLCLLLSAFLALAHPLIPLLILAHAGLLLWLRLRAQRYAYRRQGDLNRESRKVWNFGQTAQDFSCGKDIRLYGLLQPLQGAYRRVIGDYMAVLRAINNRQYALELLALPLMLASHAVFWWGVLTPGSRLYSPVLTRLPTADPVVWLTIDDGPSEQTADILDLLDAHGAKATFFVVGERAPQVALELGDELRDGLLGDAERSRDVPAARPLGAHVVEEGGVRGAEAGKSRALFEPLHRLLAEDARGLEEELGDSFPQRGLEGLDLHLVERHGENGKGT